VCVCVCERERAGVYGIHMTQNPLVGFACVIMNFLTGLNIFEIFKTDSSRSLFFIAHLLCTSNWFLSMHVIMLSNRSLRTRLHCSGHKENH
jgi:hypothetical protein